MTAYDGKRSDLHAEGLHRWDDARRYTEAYNEVKAHGSFSSPRTDRQNHLVRFYNENFAAQWNGVMRLLADRHLTTIGDTARLMALANMARRCSHLRLGREEILQFLAASHRHSRRCKRRQRGDRRRDRLDAEDHDPTVSGLHVRRNNLTGAMAHAHALLCMDHVPFAIWSQIRRSCQTMRELSLTSDFPPPQRTWLMFASGRAFTSALPTPRHAARPDGSRITRSRTSCSH